VASSLVVEFVKWLLFFAEAARL